MPEGEGGPKHKGTLKCHNADPVLWLKGTDQEAFGICPYLFRVSEVSPEVVVDARCGLLRVTGHGFDKHLQRALQEHIDAGVVVIVIAAVIDR